MARLKDASKIPEKKTEGRATQAGGMPGVSWVAYRWHARRKSNVNSGAK